MSKATEYELPKATEKLSYKYILDALNDEQKHHAELDLTMEVSPTADVKEAPQKEMENGPLAKIARCGSQEELPIDIEQEAHESIPLDDLKLTAGKKYFRIGEVADLIGVEPYVLRYWESEFSVIRPVKSSSGHRVYTRKDVEALHLIRHLLHVEKYSIKGAKKKFLDRKKQIKESHTIDRQYLKDISQELKELIQMIRTI